MSTPFHPTDPRLQTNQHGWNQRTPHHLASGFYNLAAFKDGADSLNATELSLLGDVAGKRLLHLQCHFGQDTLSLQRRGAHCTGIDFSETAIAAARELTNELGLSARFLQTDLYRLKETELTAGSFDIVFTSYGVLCWLPDLQPWAELIAHYLAPGGRFVLVEFHPMVNCLKDGELGKLAFPYFALGDAAEHYINEGTYTDPGAPLRFEEYNWNHPIGEVCTQLLGAGLQITHLQEYPYTHYNYLTGLHQTAPGQWQFRGMERQVAMLFSVVAEKPA